MEVKKVKDFSKERNEDDFQFAAVVFGYVKKRRRLKRYSNLEFIPFF